MNGVSEALLRRALGYPYSRPAASYLFAAGQSWPLLRWHPTRVEEVRICDGQRARSAADLVRQLGQPPDPEQWSRRLPVLAYGSNASPEQLRRKFPTGIIPVLRGRLFGWDVVYAASVARYGAVPATLLPSLRTAVQVWVTLLTPEQLEQMHRTESLGRAYRFEWWSGTAFQPDENLPGWDRIGVYIALSGHWRARGLGPIALAEIPAQERRLPAWSQREILEQLHARTVPHRSFAEFVAALVRDPTFRQRVQEQLRRGEL